MADYYNPMPQNGAKAGAVAIKCLIGIAALGEMVTYGISAALKKSIDESVHGEDETEKKFAKELCIADAFGIAITIIDFALSCGVGYGLYSPMDASSDTSAEKTYAKIIKETSSACTMYTSLWILKTFFLIAVPIASCFIITDKAKKTKRAVDTIGAVVVGLIALLSVGSEINALVRASQVSDANLNEAQKSDKAAFQIETTGFILSDVCALIDSVITVGSFENLPVIISREVVAFGYPITMFTEAIYISKAPGNE